MKGVGLQYARELFCACLPEEEVSCLYEKCAIVRDRFSDRSILLFRTRVESFQTFSSLKLTAVVPRKHGWISPSVLSCGTLHGLPMPKRILFIPPRRDSSAQKKASMFTFRPDCRTHPFKPCDCLSYPFQVPTPFGALYDRTCAGTIHLSNPDTIQKVRYCRVMGGCLLFFWTKGRQ